MGIFAEKSITKKERDELNRLIAEGKVIERVDPVHNVIHLSESIDDKSVDAGV